MESEPSGEQNQEVISLAKIRQKAEALLEKHKGQSLVTEGHKEDFPSEPYVGVQQAINHFLGEIPPETINRYSGHGITKGTIEDRLTALMTIAEKKLIAGWEAHFSYDRGQPSAYTEGSALVVSKIDSTLMKKVDGKPVIHQMDDGGRKIRAHEVEIGTIILNSEFYPLIDELKVMYPDETIIKANEASAYINNDSSNQ
jgi:hypothetical protein